VPSIPGAETGVLLLSTSGTPSSVTVPVRPATASTDHFRDLGAVSVHGTCPRQCVFEALAGSYSDDAARNFLELCVFLSRTLKAPEVRRVDRASKSKVVHFIQIRHRDEVEAPVTDWLQEAYELSEVEAQ
jgi:hypothetical protein